MDSDFLFYCFLSIIILSTKNKYISIISCIIFGVFIFFTRDTFGAPDSAVYVEFFTDDLDAKGYGFSTTYGLFRYLLIDIFSIPGILAYQFTTLIPLFVFSFISIKEKYIFPIFFFVSSEAFPILSFNAMRQGLGISLFILCIYFLKDLIKEKNKNKNLLILNDFNSEIKKTKEMNLMIQKLEISNSLIILDKSSKNNIEKSTRNIPNVKVTDVNHFSAYDIIKFKKVVFTESSVKELEKRYS